MQIDEFVTHLEGVKSNGSGFTALCPAHDDHTPSLSISESDDGQILIHCFAGCSPKDVTLAMKLSLSDLFTDSSRDQNGLSKRHQPKPEPKPIDPARVEQMHRALTDKIRDYLERERMLSDEVIDRYHLGVTSIDSHPRVSIPVQDEQGQYCDVRLWLPPHYRTEKSNKILPLETGYGRAQLFPLDQLKADEMVLSEGELDALALISHGVPAITSTCGAGTWPNTNSEAFVDKTVTILMDHDDAGQKGAEKRADSLARCGATVKVATWPGNRREGWDVTDELREHGVDSLCEILETAVERTSSVSSVSSVSASQGVSQDSEWPEPQPLPDKLPAVEPFKPALLPEAYRPWIEDVTERMQCPPDFPAVAAMVALAAVVGRQVGIRPKAYDDWQVVPNLWGGVIGRPGIMKSPAMQEPLKAVDQLEARAREEYEDEQEKHKAQSLIAEERKKLRQQNIKLALKDGEDPLHHALEAVAEEPEPVRRRYKVNDTTVEKLGEILRDNSRGILLFRDELTGFLKSLDREGRESDRAFYLEAWNGTGHFTYDRIGRGTIEIEAACISILGGIQPGPLSHYLRRAVRGGADDDGLLQRFQLLVWPDVNNQWKNIDRKPNIEVRQRAYKVFERLEALDLAALRAEREEGDLPFVRFAPDAQGLFVEWLMELEGRIRQGDEPPMLEAHLSKYRSLVPSLALLVHLADAGQGQVGLDALRRACAWADYLESHARRIYSPALSPASASAHALADRLRKEQLQSGFTLRELYRYDWHGLGKEEATAAVELLEDLGWLRAKKDSTGPTGGRTTTRYKVNPGIGAQNGKMD